MLFEFLESRLTPASKDARKQGYVYEAIAFKSRAKRNMRAWAGHWENCHQLVQNFCNQQHEAKTLTILGSGALFEVPKDFLVKRFVKIVLVDKVFPLNVRLWAKRQKPGQVILKEIDLADLKTTPAANARKIETDLVFSANLLSQIALKQLMQKGENDALRRQIEEAHVETLLKFRNRVLLWTDTERVYQKPGGTEVVDRSYTVLMDLPTPIRSWDWNLAPAPEWSRNADVILKMHAYKF